MYAENSIIRDLANNAFQNICLATLGVGVDSGLWKYMARDNGSPKKVPEVAEAIGFDAQLLCG